MARPAKNYDPYKLRPKSELIIALEGLDFTWFPEEAEKVKKLWRAGWHIGYIAEQTQRDQDEVAVLIMHLARKGKIKYRNTGVFGNHG